MLNTPQKKRRAKYRSKASVDILAPICPMLLHSGVCYSKGNGDQLERPSKFYTVLSPGGESLFYVS